MRNCAIRIGMDDGRDKMNHTANILRNRFQQMRDRIKIIHGILPVYVRTNNATSVQAEDMLECINTALNSKLHHTSNGYCTKEDV